MPGKKRKRKSAAHKGWEIRRSSKSPPSTRPKRLKLWSDENMKKAREAVWSGDMRINRAASLFEVPCTTLKDR